MRCLLPFELLRPAALLSDARAYFGTFFSAAQAALLVPSQS